MDTDGNKQITFEEFLSLLKQEKDSLESQMAERFGMKIYKSADGFTQEEIYDYAGAKDCVATLTLTQESAKEYGESLTVTFVYYQKDRILFILIHPWPESLVIISSGLHTMNNIARRYHASFLKIFFILK